jgi:hypothetical protein
MPSLPCETNAVGTVDQFRYSDHHEVFTEHDFNICGNPGTFTFDVTSHLQTIDNGNAFVFDFHESYTYTLVFDDAALGTWTAHAAENTHFVVNRSGTIFQDVFISREGPSRSSSTSSSTPIPTATPPSSGRSRRSATEPCGAGPALARLGPADCFYGPLNGTRSCSQTVPTGGSVRSTR